MQAATYLEAVRLSRIPDLLARHDWRITGTLPLGVDVPGSDIDIIVQADDLGSFAEMLCVRLGGFEDLSVRQWIARTPCVVAGFSFAGWAFEIFVDRLAVKDQVAVRHFEVEKRLLDLGGDAMRTAVMRHRAKGMKTEPAFATVLALVGDPYRALLELEGLDDAALEALLRERLPDCKD